ncbi:glycosyltransferase family 4 protein [Paludibaculum fermentans]|uniref:glycosyltransferase family 4 protein n=1 Tax=Paludibaculum fermentans TaxID=1473598 RepID=UPI003EB72029
MDRLIISDIPTPWREPVFERVNNQLESGVPVVYFHNNETRRLWTFKMGNHPKTILKAIRLTLGGGERFFNPGIISFLVRRRPRVVLITASIKDPSAWVAMALCQLLGTKVALLADTWQGRDRDISRLQRWARRIVYNRFGDAYVGASLQTLTMFRHYNRGIRNEQCFLSHLVADNDYFETRLAGQQIGRSFDVMFSGRIVDVKNPIFFAEVCAGIKARLGRCHVLIIGEGEEALKARMKHIFRQHGVSFEFAGFIPHAALPDYYVQSRLLLLPTSADCWGVVINEAMIAGTPVITTEWTAAAGELVLHDLNGYVLPLEVNAWIAAASDLLTNLSKWEVFSQCAHRTVREFNYDKAARGILDAFAYLNGPA